jgi:hypothetical protein
MSASCTSNFTARNKLNTTRYFYYNRILNTDQSILMALMMILAAIENANNYWYFIFVFRPAWLRLRRANTGTCGRNQLQRLPAIAENR